MATRLDFLADKGPLFFEGNTCPQVHTDFLMLTVAEQSAHYLVGGISVNQAFMKHIGITLSNTCLANGSGGAHL